MQDVLQPRCLCAPAMGGDPSKVAASVFCTATLNKPHHRRYQPWVAAPPNGVGTRRARKRTSCRRSREHARPLWSSPKELRVGSAWQRACGVLRWPRKRGP